MKEFVNKGFMEKFDFIPLSNLKQSLITKNVFIILI